jgi:hypothetical protein
VTGAVKELLTPNTKEMTAKVMMMAIGTPFLQEDVVLFQGIRFFS